MGRSKLMTNGWRKSWLAPVGNETKTFAKRLLCHGPWGWSHWFSHRIWKAPTVTSGAICYACTAPETSSFISSQLSTLSKFVSAAEVLWVLYTAGTIHSSWLMTYLQPPSTVYLFYQFFPHLFLVLNYIFEVLKKHWIWLYLSFLPPFSTWTSCYVPDISPCWNTSSQHKKTALNPQKHCTVTALMCY